MVSAKRVFLLVLLMLSLTTMTGAPSAASELTDALKARDGALVRSLLAAGADANEEVHGDYPINIAALFGPAELVAVLLDAGAGLEQQGRDGFHPLHNAAASGHSEIVALLIQKGAMVDARENKGRSALVVFAATAGSNIEIARMLLSAGADPELEDSAEHYTALDYAAINEKVDLGETLIAAHVDINRRDGGYYGDTPLGIATYYHRKKFVNWLISRGADVNMTNKLGQTPLQRTRSEMLRVLDVEQVLLDAGAK